MWHEKASCKGPHSLYHTEALDVFPLSKWHLVMWQFCLFPLTGCPSWRQLLIMLNLVTYQIGYDCDPKHTNFNLCLCASLIHTPPSLPSLPPSTASPTNLLRTGLIMVFLTASRPQSASGPADTSFLLKRICSGLNCRPSIYNTVIHTYNTYTGLTNVSANCCQFNIHNYR